MSGNNITDMREFIFLTEAYASATLPNVEQFSEESNLNEGIGSLDKNIITELEDVVFKLRSHTENEDSEISLGVEMGMQRAADMIEHLISRYSNGI